jgi:two-component system sensor histidine kinase UhpB
MMKHGYLYLVLFVSNCLTAPALAQIPTTIDSLETYLRTHTPTDSNYVRALNRTARKLMYERANYERADSLLHKSEELAQRVGWVSGLLGSYINQGTRWFLTNDPQKALAYFKKSVELADAKNRPKQELYDYTANVSVAYEKLQQWENVVQTSLNAIRMQEQYQLIPRSNAYTTAGQALKQLGKPKQALPYFQKALVIAKTHEDKRAVSIAENRIGNLFDDLEQPTVALKHYQQSLRLAEEDGFDLLQADALDNIARMMEQLKRPADGLPFAQKSLQIAEKQQNLQSMASANSTLSLLYQALKDYPKAETYLKNALSLSQKRQASETIREFTQRLAALYSEQKNYKEAYEFQLAKNNLIDSATTVRTNVAVQKLITQYETEKKEAKIKLLQQEALLHQQATERTRFRNNVLLGGGVLLLLLGAALSAWLLNRSRLRRLQETLNLRNRIAQDLHDEVGSTLSSISLLSGHTDTLLTQNRPETAQKMVQKIYTDARQILESIDEIIWTINPGNDSLLRIALRLQEYAQPLMDSQHIVFSFATDPSLDSLSVSMEVRRSLYLISKEAITNLVKYSGASEATIRFDREGDQLSVLIEDNGQGFDPSRVTNRNGQQNMQQRAEAMGGTLRVLSTPGQGTKLHLRTELV